jgi:hypothetical protein
MRRAIDCPCGELHLVRWDPRAGVDGDYVYVCPDEGGAVELRAEYGRAPGRVVTDYAAAGRGEA